MRAVVQRVSGANVSVGGQIVGAIDRGLVVFICAMDNEEPDLNWWAKRLTHLRCFSDDHGKMNHSLMDLEGGLLLISQFTLSADGKKGLRPSFARASAPDLAAAQIQALKEKCCGYLDHVETGVFAADMRVELINDGPVTLILEHG